VQQKNPVAHRWQSSPWWFWSQTCNNHNCWPWWDALDAGRCSTAKGIAKVHLIVGVDVSKVARGQIWALFYSAAWNFINESPANTVLSPVDAFFRPTTSATSGSAISAQKSGSRLSQRTAIVSLSFHFFPGLLLSSFRVCQLAFNAFALFGAHSSAWRGCHTLNFCTPLHSEQEKSRTKSLGWMLSMGEQSTWWPCWQLWNTVFMLFCFFDASGAFCHDSRSVKKQDFSSHDFNTSHGLAWPKCHALVHDWVAWDWSTSQGLFNAVKKVPTTWWKKFWQHSEKSSDNTVKIVPTTQWKKFWQRGEKSSDNTVKKVLTRQWKKFWQHSEKISDNTGKKVLTTQWKKFQQQGVFMGKWKMMRSCMWKFQWDTFEVWRLARTPIFVLLIDMLIFSPFELLPCLFCWLSFLAHVSPHTQCHVLSFRDMFQSQVTQCQSEGHQAPMCDFHLVRFSIGNLIKVCIHCLQWSKNQIQRTNLNPLSVVHVTGISRFPWSPTHSSTQSSMWPLHWIRCTKEILHHLQPVRSLMHLCCIGGLRMDVLVITLLPCSTSQTSLHSMAFFSAIPAHHLLFIHWTHWLLWIQLFLMDD